MNLSDLLDRPQALPSAPGIVQELINSFEDESVSLQDISRKIAADQVLTAKLLRLANSAHYHASRTVSTVDQAIVMLGFVAVRTLVISTGLTGSFKAIQGFNLQHFWRYSLQTAVVAKWLAKKSHQNVDLAFTAGLMHGIGQLIMHAGMPEQCLEIDKIADPWSARRIEIEKNSFGYHYGTVSAELAKKWNFPADFVTVIASAAEPLLNEPINPTAVIIHLAAWFARAQKNALTVEEMRDIFPTETASALHLTFDDINDEMPSLDELCDGLDELIMD